MTQSILPRIAQPESCGSNPPERWVFLTIIQHKSRNIILNRMSLLVRETKRQLLGQISFEIHLIEHNIYTVCVCIYIYTHIHTQVFIFKSVII